MAMRRAIALSLLLLGSASAPVFAAADAEITRDVFYGFSNGEQRLIRTMTAHPAANREFSGGLQRVLSAKNDPELLKTEIQRFRLQWRGKIDDWAARYESGDQALTAGMSSVARPSREDFARAAPWMAKIDREKFSGGLYDGVIGKMNPYEAAYSIAGLQGLSKQKADESAKKLEENSGYPTRLVAGFILDDTRQKFKGDLGDVRTAYARDKKTVLAQLQGLEAAAKLAKKKVDPEDAANAGADFDGTKEKPSGDTVVVDSGNPPLPAVGDGEEAAPKRDDAEKGRLASTKKPEGEPRTEPPSPVLSGDSKPSFGLGMLPPPKTDDEKFASRKGSASVGIGEVAKAIFQKPAVAMGAGMTLGGLLGFLLGGPIGAMIGAALGAMGGGLAASKLKD
ncbi:MAG: hypothetical protein COR54_07060 [Elusimicrobia bacterium CG22_combo_CG10-13_8_21_14_all_63_91]|nr:MAG: hypothetical protein COR54_07060 [Elusimicrobia bacterium CG22_combo_CG10-13_8_21_14_all_63_91]PJA11474.1 MAG: hypothetical protein COX66_19775 [Elusimicrobia bacterium CG_4_10_14_0_2_um_filter_63_34]